MKFTVADCVRLMPEWNDLALDIRELKGGITNQLYRVTSGSGIDCVFRAAAPPWLCRAEWFSKLSSLW